MYCAVSSENTFEIFKDRRHFENVPKIIHYLKKYLSILFLRYIYINFLLKNKLKKYLIFSKKGNQPLESFDLLGLKNIQIENDYKKKENVFRLSFLNGICYLVCAQDKNQMYSWIRQIQAGLERVNYGLLTLSAYNQIVTLRLQSSDYNHLIKNFRKTAASSGNICIYSYRTTTTTPSSDGKTKPTWSFELCKLRSWPLYGVCVFLCSLWLHFCYHVF